MDADAPLMSSGVTSMHALQLTKQLQKAAGEGAPALPSMLVFQYPTARKIAEVLNKDSPTSTSRTLHQQPSLKGGKKVVSYIAGAHGMFAGGIASSSAVRQAITCAVDVLSQVPATRWELPTSKVSDEVAVRLRHGGFLHGVTLFDNSLFGVSRVEAGVIDPSQRMLLETSYAALHGAAFDRAGLSGSMTGVFIGVPSVEFAGMLDTMPDGGGTYSGTAATGSVACGRISFVLGLNGPCGGFDSACSATLAASHLGSRALQNGDADCSLVAGVNLLIAPSFGARIAAARMQSPSGRSHTFDMRADGYARSEARGAITLCGSVANPVPTLEGSSIMQDGKSTSLTAPSGQAQKLLIGRAHTDGGLKGDELILHETHGTGTALGDPIEVTSLKDAVLNTRKVPLMVGGIKGNIGHAENAAGMTGLLGLLSLRAGEGAPSAQLRHLNVHIGDAIRDVPCVLSTQFETVATDKTAAGVSSFGYAGTIVHVVMRQKAAREQAGVPLAPAAYRCRSFGWLAAHKNWLLESKRAVHELDTLTSSEHAVPESADVAVVGAGLAGLFVTNSLASAAAAEVVVLEKSRHAGGVWRLYANATSRVNSSEPSYRLPLARTKNNTNHSHHSEIIKDCCALIRQLGSAAQLCMQAEVTSVVHKEESWHLGGQRRGGQRFLLKTPMTVLCTARRVGVPRELCIPGSDSFRGHIFRGLADDVKGYVCTSQRVVILGMGAFAIENMRVSLERAAAHVHFLCRRTGSVCPQAVDWINFIRPFDDKFARITEDDARIYRAWQTVHADSGAVRPECWMKGQAKPDGHIISVSGELAHHSDARAARMGTCTCHTTNSRECCRRQQFLS